MKKDTTSVGSAAVHITCADLILAGYGAVIAPEGMHYDVVLDAHGKLFRVQVKAASVAAPRRPKSPAVYRFATTRNHRPEIHGAKAAVRQYTEEEVDVLACVAIDIRKVAYFKVAGRFVSGIHLYPPGTTQWVRQGAGQRRLIDAYPIETIWKHEGPPTIGYGP